MIPLELYYHSLYTMSIRYTMSSLPVIRCNNFTETSDAPSLDYVCKLLIIVQFACGLNRLPLLGTINAIYLTLATLYVIFLKVSIIIFLYVLYPFENDLPDYVKLVKYLFSCLFGYFTCKRITNYYKELEKIDWTVGFRPQDQRKSITTVLQMTFGLITITAYTIACGYSHHIPINIMQVIEHMYYGHLITLLNRRLDMLVYILETSLVRKGTEKRSLKLVPLKNVEMEDVSMSQIMEAYYVIIDAGDLLIEAMKWQMLTVISVTFFSSLIWSYHIASLYLEEKSSSTESLLRILCVVTTEVLPLAAPCFGCDGMRGGVTHLRELLASKLHQTKQDKTNRNVTRALLALTNTRNMSFSLFHMVDISISLLFSLLGLIVTYLIIMLQFEKVIFQNTSQ